MERNRHLIEQYPWLCPCIEDDGTIPNEYDYSYTLLDSLPLGWRDLILELCADLNEKLTEYNLLDKYRVVEAKEKWYTLRWYDYLLDYEKMPDEIVELVARYEVRSRCICMICGGSKFSTDPCCVGCMPLYT